MRAYNMMQPRRLARRAVQDSTRFYSVAGGGVHVDMLAACVSCIINLNVQDFALQACGHILDR